MNNQAAGDPPRKPSHPLWRLTKIIVGVGLIGLGFIGLFLPILQGVLFMIVGLAILSTESRRVRALSSMRSNDDTPGRGAARMR